ncbi:MAG: hypothetical protein EPN65_05670 [Pandoraea sp.]|nr:MAG: hypothetical protein EPN65_05670 [Pandoraea sp.]
MFEIAAARAALVLLAKTGHMKNRSPASTGRSLHAVSSDPPVACSASLPLRQTHQQRAPATAASIPYLVRMHIVLLCQFGQRLLTLYRRQGHFRFERR